MQPPRIPRPGMCLRLAFLLTFTDASNATVTNVAWYRLGENDPGGISGLAITNTTTDTVGTKHLKQYGSPLYTNAVSAGASNRIGSSLAVNFSGSAQYLSNAVVSTAVNNFGLEAWVKPNTTNAGLYYIAYNGFTSANGWGLALVGDIYVFTLGGNGSYGLPSTASVGTWTHLALVRDNGTNRLYLNGVGVATNNVTPFAPTIGFEVAAAPLSGASQNFNGAIDEVRVFTFAPGQFRANDLLLPFPPVATTLPATAVTATSATLNGSANPDGLAASGWFEWGTTTNYGNSTTAQPLGVGSTDTNFSQNLTGLNIAVTYHFRAVASNNLGTAYGTNQSFLYPAFTNLPTSLLGVEKSAVAWGDYDNDGRLDLLISGYSSINAISQVWRNTGNGFTNLNALLTGAQYSSVAWCDYDNDGRLDFLLTGFDGDIISTVMRLYRNTTNGFTNLASGLPTLCAALDWGDYDRDGRMDLLLGGGNLSANASAVWRNVSALYPGAPLVDANTALPRVNGISSSVKWGDLDGDGWLDAVVAGISNSANLTQIWRNNRGSFSNLNSGLPALRNGVVAWGDYDNDGRPDLVLTGTTNANSSGNISQVWRNTGNGFTNINAGLPAVSVGSIAWGDYDNDGRLDLLLCGTTNGSSSGAICQLWRNTINGFTLVNTAFPGILNGSVAWGDYNNDGRLDIALVGESPTVGRAAQVWVNLVPATNTPPTPPDGLHAVVEDNSVVLKWNPSTDAQTPSGGLTYNVRIGTTPGGSDVVAPMSDATGLRRLPQPGNARQSLRWPADNLPLDRVLYWSVQAVDTAFAGSAFSAESTFKLLYAPPALVPPSATVSVLGDTNGDGVLDESEKNIVLANYFANSPWLMMTNVAGLGGTNVTFALTNELAGAFSVEFTTNLADWFFLGPAIPRYLFTDTNAPAVPLRHYRLRWP